MAKSGNKEFDDSSDSDSDSDSDDDIGVGEVSEFAKLRNPNQQMVDLKDTTVTKKSKSSGDDVTAKMARQLNSGDISDDTDDTDSDDSDDDIGTGQVSEFMNYRPEGLGLVDLKGGDSKPGGGGGSDRPPNDDPMCCNICRETMEAPPKKRVPKVLQCLHTFCEECLQNIADSTRSTPITIECTICKCKTTTQSIDNLLNNFILIKKLQEQVQELNPSLVICDNCESEDFFVKHFCVECSENLCGECVRSHQRGKKTKTHEVIPLDKVSKKHKNKNTEAQMECPKHSGEFLKMFCETCDVTICVNCTKDHKKHDYSFFTESAPHQREIIKSLLAETRSERSSLDTKYKSVLTVQKEFNAQKKKAKSEFSTACKTLQKAISDRESQLAEKINTAFSLEENALAAQRSELRQALANLDHGANFTWKTLSEGSDIEVLTFKAVIVEHLKQLKSATVIQVKKQVKEFALDFDCSVHKEIEKKVSKMGNFTVISKVSKKTAGKRSSGNSGTTRPTADTGGTSGIMEGEIVVRDKYRTDFDKGGILYWIGTKGGKLRQWFNPALHGFVRITRKARTGGDSARALCRAEPEGWCISGFTSRNIRDAGWFSFDFMEFLIKPNRYTLRHGRNNGDDMLRNWVLEASNDGRSWTILKKHIDDTSLNGSWGTSTWRITSDKVDFYRCFRVRGTGQTTREGRYDVMIGGLEFYGEVMRIKHS